MRKLFKTAIPVTGIIIVSTMFTGCSGVKQADKLTVSDLFADALNVIKNSDSLCVDGDIDMDIKMESSGLSVSFSVTGDAKMEADIKNDAIHSEFDANIDALGISQSMFMENYMVRDGENIISYTAQSAGDSDDKQWAYSVKDSDGFSIANFLDEVDVKDAEFKEYLESVTTDLVITKDTETIDNKACYVVNGILQLDAETLNGISSDYMTDVNNDKYDIKSVWYFSKDNHELKRVELDFASSIKNINTDSYEITFEPNKLDLTFNFSRNEKVEVTVPEEIKENAKESVDSDHAFDLLTEI